MQQHRKNVREFRERQSRVALCPKRVRWFECRGLTTIAARLFASAAPSSCSLPGFWRFVIYSEAANPTITVRKSRERSHLSAGGPHNAQGVHRQCRAGILRIFLLALARRKVADSE